LQKQIKHLGTVGALAAIYFFAGKLVLISYFRNHGLISVVIVNARTVEAGVVGNEGIVGLEGLMGLKRGPLREIVQTDEPRLFSDDAGYGAEQRDRGRAFAKKKIIQHPRGSVRILNRKALEESSCDLLRADSRLQRRAHRLGGLLGDLFREFFQGIIVGRRRREKVGRSCPTTEHALNASLAHDLLHSK
jgi:hypothetical protein